MRASRSSTDRKILNHIVSLLVDFSCLLLAFAWPLVFLSPSLPRGLPPRSFRFLPVRVPLLPSCVRASFFSWASDWYGTQVLWSGGESRC